MSKHHKSLRGWAAARKKALNLAGYRCSTCGRPGALFAHHKQDLAHGGAGLDQDNIIILCLAHHREAHQTTPAVHVQGQADWKNYLKELAAC